MQETLNTQEDNEDMLMEDREAQKKISSSLQKISTMDNSPSYNSNSFRHNNLQFKFRIKYINKNRRKFIFSSDRIKRRIQRNSKILRKSRC